ncbi:hypothetical protein [Flavobacterium davisii]|uniref:hypothetical protein n=1 Tax=Flavobacterium davisii TaxID=2906077 RepID=UPI0035CFD5C9
MTPVFHVPYSSRLSDYANSMDVRMRLLVNTTDIGINNRQVRLKMYVQGNGIQAQSSEVVVGMNPIYINGGELLTLTNLELAPLFRLENLEGMSPSQYANALPEGLYTVCFELYDFLTNQKISQKSCAQLYLMLNDPPLLNTPSRNESIAVSDFPNILFTWTPRQINATNVSYQFELKEILDPTIDPQIGFLTSPLLYEEELRSTALLYDVSKPNLLPGKRYAWRVRAMSTSGLSLNNVFKNEGYSEIYHFTYASHCPAPTFILSEAVSARSVRVSWLGDKSHTKYHLQYKKAPPLGAGGLWFEVYTMNPQTTLSDLEAGVSYEFRVGGSCEPAVLGNTGTFTYSGINQFSMPAAGTSNTSFTCGLNPTIAIANQTPINNLIVSETFTAGDFPVKILELTGNNPYTGKGYIIVPYLADTKIAVAFNNITVNTNYQLIKGVVETTYNPEAPNISDVEDLSGGNNQNSNENSGSIVTFPITSTENIQVNTSQSIINITSPNGQIITIPINSNSQTTTVTDSQGNSYEVNNSTGEVKSTKSISEVVTTEEQAKAELKFAYKGVEFLHKDKLATMLHGKDLKIEIKKKNESISLSIEKTKLKLDDKDVNLIKENGKYFVTIKADAATLKKEKTKLIVLDSIGKTEIAILNIVTYTAPVVKFNRPDNYTGEFLYDDGFERHATIKSNTYYQSIIVGKKKEVYYAPVIGLKKDQIATIKVDFNDFDDIAKKDPDFKLVFRPTVQNKIEINKQSELEVNANDIKTLNQIIINALEYVNIPKPKTLDPILIEVFVKETKEKVGLIEYYCAETIKKNIHLIYVKFNDDITYPSPFTNQSLQYYLNTHSHNQFFIKYTVDSENFNINQTKTTFSTTYSSTNDILKGLDGFKFPGVDRSQFDPPNYDKANDYYYVTSLVREKASVSNDESSQFLGGAHFTGGVGGFHVKATSSIGETQEELAAHEFGHWLRLPHTFESNGWLNIILDSKLSNTKHNFMDYQINRKTWFKIQLLNTERTSK